MLYRATSCLLKVRQSQKHIRCLVSVLTAGSHVLETDQGTSCHCQCPNGHFVARVGPVHRCRQRHSLHSSILHNNVTVGPYSERVSKYCDLAWGRNSAITQNFSSYHLYQPSNQCNDSVQKRHLSNWTIIPQNNQYHGASQKIPLSFRYMACSRYFSISPDDKSGFDNHFKDDPEVKAWLQEMNEDIHNEIKDKLTDEEVTSSSDEESSSESDSDPESEDQPSSPSSLHPARASDDKDLKLNSVEVEKGQISDLETEYEDYLDVEEMQEEDVEVKLPISLRRGVTGVFDIDELVTLLKEENAQDICVIDVEPELKYVDHLVVISGRSTRHLKAMAQLVRWVFKRKGAKYDPKSVKIEGEQTTDWLAMDLGNIALHLFLPETRQKYDLESLWTGIVDYDQGLLTTEDDPFAAYLQGFTTMDDEPGTVKTEEADMNSTKCDTEEVFRQEPGMENIAGWHKKES